MSTDTPVSTGTPTFADLGVPAPLVRVLDAQGKTEPFPIQSDTIADTLAGRDVLGRGKTGSGKTLAFSLPLVARLGAAGTAGRRPNRPRGLVLAPTRELVTQILETIRPLADAYGLKATTIFGGVSQHRQVEALRGGIDIVVAAPGRLDDLMKQGLVHLDDVEITVLDEADHMADLGFLPVVTRILSATPAKGQRMLFSATLDNGVDKLVRRFLHDEVLHSVDEANSPVAAMTHHVFEASDAAAKKDLVTALASGRSRRILFMRTKHQAKKLARQLTDAGIPAVDLHGNLSQPQRDRNLAAFGAGTVRVLVATDVAARGVHVDDVALVVHVDPPEEHKAYLHRAGRTARAGSAGDVVTIMLPEQRRDTMDLLRKAAIRVTPVAVRHDADAVTALVGERAEYVTPVPRETQPQGGGRSQGANAQRKRAARAEAPARGEGSGRGESSGRGEGSGRGRGQGVGSTVDAGRGQGSGRRRGRGRGQGGAQTAGADSTRAEAPGRGQNAGRARGAGGAQDAGGAQSAGRAQGHSAGGRSQRGSGSAPRPMRVGDLVSSRARDPRTNRRAQG